MVTVVDITQCANLADAFWEQVDKSTTNGCWLWKGPGAQQGTGYMQTDLGRLYVQRFAYYLTQGIVPTHKLGKTCGVKHCLNPAHLTRLGDIDDPRFQANFWAGVQPAPDDHCWPWMRSTIRGGYGQFTCGSRSIKAHKTAFYYANGYWPRLALHSCDNPICCNPKHLWDGTHKDNTQDMLRKGRQNPPVGERSGHAKLTDDLVRGIREEYAAGGTSYTKLAKKHSVCFQLIGQVVTRKIWRHI